MKSRKTWPEGKIRRGVNWVNCPRNSPLKAHAAEIVRTLSAKGEPLVITQNREVKAVLQDIESYEQSQETIALLKIFALGTRQVEEGKVQFAGDVVQRLRDRSTSR